jgi:hypothetical protein
MRSRQFSWQHLQRVIAVVHAPDFLNILDANRHQKGIFQRAAGNIPYPAFVDALAHITGKRAFRGPVFFVAWNHARQRFNQRRACLRGNHTPRKAAVHAEIANQHCQDLIGAEVNAALIHDAVAVRVGILPIPRWAPFQPPSA